MIQSSSLKIHNMKSLTATAKKITSVSLLILMIPFLFFVSRLLLSINVLPDAWIDKFSQNWSSLLRIVVFAVIVIMLPLIALILNLVSLNRLQNVEGQVGIRLINYLIIAATGFVILLFTIVMLTD